MKTTIGMLLLLTLAVISAGCSKSESSFEPNTFSNQDMCIVKKNDKQAAICYGMTRAKAEEIAGIEMDSQVAVFSNYSSGLKIFYRDNAVAGVALVEGSEGAYETARGAELGMSRSEIMKLYGEEYAITETERNLDYAYDTTANKFSNKTEAGGKSQGESQSIYLFSSFYSGEEQKAETLFLIDRKMAVFMN
ncbi:hypothetical protein [Paenibacillus sp. GCM10027626]|uniref:hypothetical protein n=1 Tax=Paenibacillus sp. GCM10027626 TaxID=3273411 RepID=UPI0036279239